MKDLLEHGFKQYRPNEFRLGSVCVVVPPTLSGRPYLVYVGRSAAVCDNIDQVMAIVVDSVRRRLTA